MRSRGLDSLQLENFKGFKDTGKLNLSKINIIVGKNSSGKSSLLKSIIASSQSVSQEPVDSSDFRLAGENVDLGSFRDTIHRGDIENKFSIKFGYSFKLPRYFMQPPGHRRRLSKSDWSNSDPISFESKFSYKSGEEAYSARISNIDIYKNSEKFFSSRGISRDSSKRDLKRSRRELTYVRFYGEIDSETKEWIELGTNKDINFHASLTLPFTTRIDADIETEISEPDFLELKREIMNLKIESKENIAQVKTQLEMLERTLRGSATNLDETREIWEDTKESLEEHEMRVSSLHDVLNQRINESISELKSLEDIVNKDVSDLIKERIQRRKKDRGRRGRLGRSMRIQSPDLRLVSRITGELQERILGKISYLGPIREEPLRQSILAQSSGMVSGKKGSNLAGILHSNLQKSEFKADFDKYLQKLDIAESIETIEDKRDDVPTGYINILINSGNKTSSLVDVGFGTSQVLPVIFELMAHKEKIIVIEQPELHLHPSAQAELGNLLKDSILRNNQLFIETHSINLIERLRRLMRVGELDSKDVRLIYVNKDKDGDSHCTQIGFLSDGSLDSPWPEKDFFGERGNEVMSDR